MMLKRFLLSAVVLLSTAGAIRSQDVPAPLTVSAQFSEAKDGKPAQLFISAIIPEGWHTYSLTQKKGANGGPNATKIRLTESSEFNVLAKDFVPHPGPTLGAPVEEWPDLPLEEHHDEVIWTIPIEIAAGIDVHDLTISGKVNCQRCKDGACVPPANFSFSAKLGEGMLLVDGLDTAPAVGPPHEPPSEQVLDVTKLRNNKAAQESESASLPLMIGFGFLGGLILNLMPCVLPVIGLKIMSFVQQSGQDRRRILMLNVWYSLGLLSVFMVLATLAVVLGLGWGGLFRYSEFNIAVASVVFAMALSFLGVWEIPIPGFATGGKTSELASREGPAGAFAKGAITTVLATPCSGPFLGSALAFAVRQPPHIVYAMFAAVGLGMASPYLALGAFPQLIRSLPKPGAWMDTFKQFMGFGLLATVVYLLTFIPMVQVVPTVSLLIGLWAACWWIGRIPFGADFGVKVRAWLVAGATAAMIGWFSFGWLAEVMSVRFDRAVTARVAQLRNQPKPKGDDQLTWEPFSRERLDVLVRQGKTVMVDFTADWCATCKVLEATVLNTADVRKSVQQNGIVTLVGDWTLYEDAKEVDEMLALLGPKQVPTLAIFPSGRPNEPVVLRDGYTKHQLLKVLKEAGPSRDVAHTDNAASRLAQEKN